MNNNLSTLLGARLLKISDVAVDTGLSRTTLTEIYYKRATDIKLSTLEKICDYLDIPLSELIVYNEKSKQEA